METAATIGVQLVGGPMDGDELLLVPNGSVGPPQQLCYMTSNGEEAGWMVYEAENAFVGAWPEMNEQRKFHYVGTYDLGKGRRI